MLKFYLKTLEDLSKRKESCLKLNWGKYIQFCVIKSHLNFLHVLKVFLKHDVIQTDSPIITLFSILDTGLLFHQQSVKKFTKFLLQRVVIGGYILFKCGLYVAYL